MIFRYLRQKRRERIRRSPAPDGWKTILLRRMPYWRYLSEPDREKLLDHIKVFLNEKEFVGCNGLTMTDDIRVSIAAWACLLILHRPTEYYPDCGQILVYPDSFEVPIKTQFEAGDVFEGEEARDGESWQYGSVIISWQAVREAEQEHRDGYNVVIHEFAHQLDQEDGSSDGAPALGDREFQKRWTAVFTREYHELCQAEKEGREDTVLDPYGAESPAEFFAVACETFFDNPHIFRDERPALYDCLKEYFRQDPATLLPTIAIDSGSAPNR